MPPNDNMSEMSNAIWHATYTGGTTDHRASFKSPSMLAESARYFPMRGQSDTHLLAFRLHP